MQKISKEQMKSYLKKEDSVLFYGGEVRVNNKTELKEVLDEAEEAFYHGEELAEERLSCSTIKADRAEIYTVYKGIHDVNRLLLVHYPKSKKLKIYRLNY